MRFVLIAVAAIVLLGACGKNERKHIDRSSSPEAALQAAQAALGREDFAGYLDTLTINAVRLHLRNAVGICLISLSPAAEKIGLDSSSGCDAILRQHGWSATQDLTPEGFEAEMAKVADPRALTLALVNNSLKTGSGIGFAWDHLEGATLTDVAVQGDRATAKLHWPSSDASTAVFERDPSGWRFDPGMTEEELAEEEDAEEGEEP